MPEPARYLTLDAWRGIACLLVVVSHSTLFLVHTARPDAGGAGEWLVQLTGRMTVGVPLFFVISGYCIAAAADSARRRGSGVGRYFARRFRRIYPPYWAAVALAMLFAFAVERAVPGLVSGPFGPVAVVPDPASVAPLQWLGSLTLTETWRPLAVPDPPELQVLGPAWTLCYEEQFYAVTGVLLLVAGRRFFAGVAAVTAVVFVGVVLGWGGASVKGTFLDGRWLMFAAGVGVYWAAAGGRGHGRVVAVAALLLAGAGYACRDLDVLLDQRLFSPLADGKELLPACLFALALLVLRRRDARTADSGPGRALGAVGRYSYSLYLVHYPICLAVGHLAYRAGVTGAWPTLLVVVPVCVSLSVAAGRAFHAAVERRFTPSVPSS